MWPTMIRNTTYLDKENVIHTERGIESDSIVDQLDNVVPYMQIRGCFYE